LSWSAVAPAIGTAISYVVSIDGKPLPAQTGRTFNPTSLQMPVGSAYQITVQALATRFGLSTPSLAATTTVDLTIPAAPTAVKTVAGAAGSQRITVNWTDASSNETGFTVQRATVTGGVVGGFSSVRTVAAGEQTYLDTNVTSGRTYQYQVRANGAALSSAYTVASTSPVLAP
jgi:hypothetical protein